MDLVKSYKFFLNLIWGYVDRPGRHHEKKDSLEKNWCNTRFLQKKALDEMEVSIEEIKQRLSFVK